MTNYTVPEIVGMLADRVEALCPEILPGGRRVGYEWRAGSVNGEAGQSLGIHLQGERAGVWADFATDQRGDALDLVQTVLGLDKAGAVVWSKRWLGLDDGKRVNGANGAAPLAQRPDDRWRAITPIPKDAPKAPEHSLGKPDHLWPYRDSAGHVLLWVCRWDTPEGKEIRPLTYWRRPDGSQGWEWKHLSGQRPLYGLDRLAKMSGASVHIVEGEKACEAAQKLFPEEPCITWPGGTNAVLKADWSPLSGRRVLIWPDNDNPGRKAAEAVAHACASAGATEIRIVQTPTSFAERWDVADPLPFDAPLDMLDKLRRDAAPYELLEVPEKTPDRRLPAVDIETFLKLVFPPRQMILSPILPTQGLMMVYARPGIGKTYLGLNIAYAIACGSEFLRWCAPKPRRILYIDGEMSGTDMKRRIAEAVQGSPNEPPSSDYFRLITPDLYPEGIPDLSTEEGQKAVDENLDGVSVVVVDNLSALCRTGRENESESWEPMQQWMLSLKRRGICVVLIHHAGKGGKQRGTSKREDVLDTIICLNRPEDYRPEEGARFEVHFEKARGIVGDDAKTFEARMETRDGAAIWTVRDIEDVEVDTVRNLTNEGLSAREIEAETGMSKSKVNRIQKHIRAEALADVSPARYQD